MSSVKFSIKEELYSTLLKYYYNNYKYWKLYINKFDCNPTSQEINVYKIYCENIFYLDNLLNKLEISPTDKLVFVKAVIENIDSNEEIGKYFNYSESGLRNRVNIILKQLINIILKEESN